MTSSRQDILRQRIAAYEFPHSGVEVVRANRGYTLYSLKSGGPVARFRPTGQDDQVQVLWWRREAWGHSGDLARSFCPSTKLWSSSRPKVSSGSTCEPHTLTKSAKSS